MFIGPDFGILHLEESYRCILAQWMVNFGHEFRSVYFDFLKHFINVFLDGKQIGFDSFFLKELNAILLSWQILTWDHDINVVVHLSEDLG